MATAVSHFLKILLSSKNFRLNKYLNINIFSQIFSLLGLNELIYTKVLNRTDVFLRIGNAGLDMDISRRQREVRRKEIQDKV